MTPVPAPSSTTTSLGLYWVCVTIWWHNVADDGTIEPICSGLANQRRKNMLRLATFLLP